MSDLEPRFRRERLPPPPIEKPEGISFAMLLAIIFGSAFAFYMVCLFLHMAH